LQAAILQAAILQAVLDEIVSASHKPPSKWYFLAAAVIAVAIWMVLGAPDSDFASTPIAIARSGAVLR
jgi:hypothetical protein